MHTNKRKIYKVTKKAIILFGEAVQYSQSGLWDTQVLNILVIAEAQGGINQKIQFFSILVIVSEAVGNTQSGS